MSELGPSFIQALTSRLDAILPHRTGHSLAEVELDSQFIVTTNLILKNCKPNEFNGNQHFFSELLNDMISIVEKLNIDSVSRKLLERNSNVLASTVILTRLLRLIAITNWDPERNYCSTEDSSLDVGIKFDIESCVTDSAFELYAHRQPPLVQIESEHVLDVLFTLISPEVNNRGLSEIRNYKTTSREVDYSVTSQLNMSPQELRSQILEIDSNISTVLRYIAASNSSDYANFIQLKLFSYVTRGENIPLAALQRYACSLMFIYCTPESTSSYLKRVYSAIPFIRLSTWKQLFLHYESVNLRTQCINRPDFYSTVIFAGSSAEQACKIIFDYISTAFESESNTSMSLFSWYVALCPSDFDEFLRKSAKIKQAFNKRTKFLNTIIRDSQAGANLESFESLINIFLIGSLSPDNISGVKKFSTKFLDETFINFSKMRSRCSTELLSSRFRILYQKLFTAAIAIMPEKFIPLFVREFQKRHINQNDTFLARSSALDSRDLLEVIMALSSHNKYKDKFDLVMTHINPSLSNIMHFCAHLLSQNKSATSNLRLFIVDEIEDSSSFERYSSRSQSWPKPQDTALPDDQVILIMEILRLTLDVYTEGSRFFLQFDFKHGESSLDQKVHEMHLFADAVFSPLGVAICLPDTKAKSVFKSACKLSMKLLQAGNAKDSTDETHCVVNFISHNVIRCTCEVIGTLSYPAFKESFIFLKTFLSEKFVSPTRAQNNAFYQCEEAHSGCQSVCTSLDKLLMLCLCTHDIQFFSLLKLSIRAHTFEASATKNRFNCFHDSLAESFSGVMGDDIVFTGFVSLHKKFKTILTDFEPTKGLYEAWLMIFDRWENMVVNITETTDESFTFKHYTEFLATTSICFLGDSFAKSGIGSQESATRVISSFYDRAVSLLSSEKLFIRVVIREALSGEAHPQVYQLIHEKITCLLKLFKDTNKVSGDSILFFEEAVSIFTAILNIKSTGAFVLAALLPEKIEIFFDYVDIVPNPIDQIKLKLRLCKLASVISGSREKFGISGAYKLRNKLAKIAAEWLDAAVSSSTGSSMDSTATTTPNGRTPDTEFLQIELATECAKSFALQLQSLVLTVPDGTKESNFEHARSLVFSGYFSVFYKIFEKFNGSDPSPLMIKSRFKIQTITDHVLQAFSSVLRANVGIGLEFALPLGYHENERIRPIFLEIFATTLSAGELKLREEEFSEEKIDRLSEIVGVFGAAAQVASPAEHNLLATSLNGIFGYTKRLDELFITLLGVELQSLNRASDIFRGNSTLTRLMSIFAKEYGTPYLTVVLRPFVEDMVENDVIFEVEKEERKEDVDLFIAYLRKLVKSVVHSISWVPEPFKFICFEIRKCVGKKFDDASLIAVGSFLFLRFFCPAIVSPESFFDLTEVSPKVKRSLMQIVKTIQYMANGSIQNLRWASLSGRSEEMSALSAEIFHFMSEIAAKRSNSHYVFHRITLKPLTCLRYFHKFFFTYFIEIRHSYLIESLSSDKDTLQQKLRVWKRLDQLMSELGNPKPSISLQGTKSYKSIDVQSNLGNSQFTEFMAKMSAKNIETSIESPIITNRVFHDGTPVVVITIRHIKEISYDVSTLAYLLLENVSQIWENQFYCVIDLTQFYYMGIIGKNFSSLLQTYAPKVFFTNCKRTYYYNLPRAAHLSIIDSWTDFRPQNGSDQSIFLYTEQDNPEMIESICLSKATLAIPFDVKIVCRSCKLYDEATGELLDVVFRLGRSWLSIWFERFELNRAYSANKTVAPVEVLRLADLVKFEVSNKSGESNEFTLCLNRYNYQVTLVTPQREEILRFLYLSKLRSSKLERSHKLIVQQSEYEQSQRFSSIATLSFHGLLQSNDDVRIAASKLLKSFTSYYDITFDSSSRLFSKVSFAIDMTDFVVSYSSKLSHQFPKYSHEFFKTFFANFDKFSTRSKISGIMYISPWVVNLYEQISEEIDSVEKLSFVVRQLCKITIKNPTILSLMKEYIWKKLFSDMRMTKILVDELIAIAMETEAESDDWSLVISVFHPSVELCGELVSKLYGCIYNTKLNDPIMMIQSRKLEMAILVKICSSLFFDTYVYGSLYLSDVFLFCTLFIDRPDLDFGHDLQSLVLSTIQSFASKSSLQDDQVVLINETVEFFSSQRAKMLFGLTSKDRGIRVEFSQNYERALSFEHLCDYLNDFLSKIGSADDKKFWVSRWASLSKDIAFSDSYFQMRAYTIVCTLARSGISDSVGGRVMEKLTGELFDDPASFFEGSVCLLRLMQGLASDSVHLPLLVWVVAGAILSEFPVNYQAMISALGMSFEKMIEDKVFNDKVFAIKSSLDPLQSSFESMVNIKITRDNYEFVFLFMICRGLTVSQARHTSIITIRRSLIKKGHLETIRKPTNASDFTLAFVLIYYISVPDSTFRDMLGEIGLENTQSTSSGKDNIPDFLLEGLCSNSDSLDSGFILAAHVFSGDCEQIYRNKFISLFIKVLEVQRDSALKVFHIIEVKLRDIFVDAPSSITDDISKILMDIVRDRDYNPQFWKREEMALVRSIGVGNVQGVHNFESLNEASESIDRMAIVRQLFYRNLCSLMEGSKLEKY